MHIKSIFVEGFKSYAKRTEITGFDPAFNAITGLNGSGKSNILDSICFVLGITNLSQVRASNLQDLVYKSGQAGITKATVSIVFENREKSTSPIGYENFDELTITRQIVIGGKNKYLINGITANNTRVQDLFRSVQLNVNNPHFLIMQGRITKVLNMKPPEILSLLEEAASTKHYEVKREETLKTIEKKDCKLREIDKILKEEIQPTLAKLNEERLSYLEYQKVVRDLEYLNKFLIAYDYMNKKAIVDNSEGELARMKEQQTHEELIRVKCDENKIKLDTEIDSLCEERDQVHIVRRNEMQVQYSELQKEEAILKNTIKRAEDALKESKITVKTMEKHAIEDAEDQKKTEKEIATLQAQFDKMQSDVATSAERLQTAKQRLLDVNSGNFVSGNVTGTLEELVGAAEKAEGSIEIQLNVLRQKHEYVSKMVHSLQKQLATMPKNESVEQQGAKLRQLQTEVARIEADMSATGFDEDRWKRIQTESAEINKELYHCTREREEFLRTNHRFDFQYRQPHSNFDDSKIIGAVASLITLKKLEFAIALEIGTISRIFHIVVDLEETAVELCDKGCLIDRVTLLPLDTIRYRVVPNNVLDAARRIVGPDNGWNTIELIDFDKANFAAVANVFGGFLVARSLNHAKTIAFDPQIRCRAVTLDGETYDPEGSLVGGSAPRSSGVFQKANQLAAINRKLIRCRARKSEIDAEFTYMRAAMERWNVLHDALQERQAQLTRHQAKMMNDCYYEIQQSLAETTAERDEQDAQIRAQSALLESARAETAEAKTNLANSAAVEQQSKKAAETEYESAKTQLEQSEVAFKDIESRFESLSLEKQDHERQQLAARTELETAIATVATRETERQQHKEALTDHIEQMRLSKADLDQQTTVLKTVEATIVQLREQVQESDKAKDQAEFKLGEIGRRIVSHKKDSEEAERKLAKMLGKYAWIEDESKHFNQPGGIYDFANRDWREAQENIEKLEATKSKLSKKVNLRGMHMMGQTQERYNELISKYQRVLQDKKILQDVIDELDKLKAEVIRKCHEQVDKDFDKIFSTLLPGSQARLTPCEGKELSEGLEFRIAFGNVWKDSLNELSGGQRSLVALSLILALLRFKPAPLYILDEVDAALDISHTTNIGTLIKEQFANSQFVIVSLKDGMFNNANVLFKTKFVDGLSTVTRHVNAVRRPMAERNH